MTALWELSRGQAGAAVQVGAVDDAIGRGRRDMRTPLDLAALAEQGLVGRAGGGGWALTQQGVEWLREDRELSDR